MPRWMRHYLIRRSIKHHLFISLALGLVLRSITAYFVYGPQALDDYKHGVWPAYQFFAGLPLDLPEYRSHLLVWCLAGMIEVGSWFGVQSALGQVRSMYLGLGLVSLSGIYGTYLWSRTLKTRLVGPLAMYLLAAFPLMPFLSTRAFGEAVATSLVVLAFGIMEDLRRSNSRSLAGWSLGFSVLGLAVLFRFHVGLMFFAYASALIYLGAWPGVIGALLGGLLTLVAQFTIDNLSGKPAFGTLLSYLAENEGGAAKYGVSPWYNTWAFVLVISLAPFSFVFIPKLPGLWRRHWPWLMPFLIYIGVHSLVPHKEERFLYPIVGLELWAMAWLWASSAWVVFARSVYSSAMLLLGVPLLCAACLLNTQEGEIEPPAYAESHYRQVLYLDLESLFAQSRVKSYFLRPPSVLQNIVRDNFNLQTVDQALTDGPNFNAVVLLTSVPEMREPLQAMQGMKFAHGQCRDVRVAGSLIDRLLYSLNPKHNERRRPTWYLLCERGS